MLKIEINEQDGRLFTVEGISKKTGNPYTMRQQVAYMHNGGIYPQKISFQLSDKDIPYAFGLYTFDPSSFYVGEFGKPCLVRNPKLIPLK